MFTQDKAKTKAKKQQKKARNVMQKRVMSLNLKARLDFVTIFSIVLQLYSPIDAGLTRPDIISNTAKHCSGFPLK